MGGGSLGRRVALALGVLLSLFTVAEVNYPRLDPQSELAIFAGVGLVLCFLLRPVHPRLGGHPALCVLDWVLAGLAAAVCLFIVVQSQPGFDAWRIGGTSLGNRAGQETQVDTVVGVVGLLLVLEATRRSIGAALPLLSLAFLAYAFCGPWLPTWLFAHRGYGVERVVAQTFLHSQGVFGVALRVMFVYVFLFVLFGAFLQVSGATKFIIDFSRRALGRTPGGPAKVAVLSSGLMGSLSGSAVANVVTTGTFTIPVMKSAGFKPEVAGGIEAAASSGGALVPPVMGAGAYMMLEIVDPPVTYLQIVRAALIPAVLYYGSLLLLVHFHAKKEGLTGTAPEPDARNGRVLEFEGLVFVTGLATLVGALLFGYSAFRAATWSLVAVLVVGGLHPRTRIGWRRALDALASTARDMIPLVAASACVGIVIGVVTLTGIGSKLPTAILGLSQGSLFAALALIMTSSIVLGMGLPSAVCYLLLATMVGPILGQLGVVPLGAHLFIFYFGMLSMVTPPVALAAYAAASIAGANIMQTGLAAFRFALVGFTLPYMFVLRPELLMLSADGRPASWGGIAYAAAVSLAGLVPFAAGIAGHLFAPLAPGHRALLFASAGLLLVPDELLVFGRELPLPTAAGLAILVAVALVNRRARRAVP
jgi:TRAP transporter 4TM/12TM fusion protein